MKIGVFGDSFADQTSQKIWWRYLQDHHGHNVISYGQSGSSLGFSVECMENYAADFDHLIWCVTTVNRISIWHDDKIYHLTGTHPPDITRDTILDHKLDVIHHYLTEAFDGHYQEILGHSLVYFMLNKYPNLTIIPSFSTPVYFMKEHKFNLYDLCQQEASCVFPGQDLYHVVNGPKDRRQGHLTDTNQRILAQLINNNLAAGIFCTEYKHFNFDPHTLSREFCGVRNDDAAV